MGNIFHSVSDSAILGLKAGHAIASAHNIPHIITECLDDKYDVCRLRISEEEKATIFETLEQSGIKWHHAYDIINLCAITGNYGANMPLTQGVDFKVYTKADKELLTELVKLSFADDPIGYYQSPELAKHISKEQEAECLAYYITTQFNGPEDRIWIVYYLGEPVGFTANRIDISKGKYESYHAGIIPQYRNAGLFASLIRYNINYGQSIGIKVMTTGSRSYNKASQSVFESEKLLITGVDAIIHLMPLLQKGKH